MAPLTVSAGNEAATARLAADIAAVLRRGDVIALHGDLGMGKSAFARALLRALAGDPDLEVPSPTFTLAQSYETARLAVTHFDLYRLSDPDELVELGFDEAIERGAVLVEWPDRAGDRLPALRLDVVISQGPSPDARLFSFASTDAGWTERLDRTFAIRALLDGHGLAAAERQHLHGDASTRSFERAVAGDRSAVVMYWPGWRAFMRRTADDRYEDIVHLTDSLTAFEAIADTLRRRGFRSPRILGADAGRRLMLIEDLGSDMIVRDGRPIPERYRAAAERIADIAADPWPQVVETDAGERWRMPVYDRRALATEAGLFATWYVPVTAGAPLDPALRAEWDAIWARLLSRFDDDQAHLVMRDYHSPNILWQDGEADPVGLIDFQDSQLGSAAYDLASLVTDARVDIDDGLAEAMTAAYVARRQSRDPRFDAADFRERVVILGAQRNAKILGRFVEYAERTGRRAHLRFVPRVRRNLERALAYPVLAELKLWYERLQLPPSS